MKTELIEVFTNPIVLVALGGALAQGIAYIFRHYRDRGIYKHFIISMATNHLPHIYTCQTLIANHLGVRLPKDPAIEFVNLDK